MLLRSRVGIHNSPGFGLFAGGNTGLVGSTYTDRYQFSTNSVKMGTVLGTSTYGAGSASNSVLGIIGGGNGLLAPIANTSKYVFLTNVVTPLTVLASTQNAAATSSSPGNF